MEYVSFSCFLRQFVDPVFFYWKWQVLIFNYSELKRFLREGVIFLLVGMVLVITVTMEGTKALIQRVFRLTREMISLSDEGLALSDDDGCRVLLGVLQDCAYRIRQQAERELARFEQTV